MKYVLNGTAAFSALMLLELGRVATLNRATVKRRHFNGRQLTGATFKRSDN